MALYPLIVYILRGLHVLVAFFLSACLLYLYYTVVKGAEITAYVWGAVVAILAEGMVFFGLGRDCPLSMWQRRYGDEKGFFELCLPPRAARTVWPVLLVTAAVPILVVIGRALR